MELSTTIGNNILTQYSTTQIVCPQALKSNAFTRVALDNIDLNPSSIIAEGSFHGTGMSLFQYPTIRYPGVKREIEKPRFIKKKIIAPSSCV